MIIRIKALKKVLANIYNDTEFDMVIYDAYAYETPQELMYSIVDRAIDKCEELGLEYTGYEIVGE